jgi:hypothetical protein
MPKFVGAPWGISLKLSDSQLIQEQGVSSKTHFSPPARCASLEFTEVTEEQENDSRTMYSRIIANLLGEVRSP